MKSHCSSHRKASSALALGFLVAVLLPAGFASANDGGGAGPSPTGRSVTLLERSAGASGGNFFAWITTLEGRDHIAGIYHATHLDSQGNVGPGPGSIASGNVAIDSVLRVLIRFNVIWNYDFFDSGTITARNATLWFAPFPLPANNGAGLPAMVAYGRAPILQGDGTGKYQNSQGYVEMYFLSPGYCLCFWVLTNNGANSPTNADPPMEMWNMDGP